MATKDDVGRYGETVAARHLEDLGMVVLDRNWRHHEPGFRGELDLVARDGEVVVAVEVKTRRSLTYGSGVEAVTPRKVLQVRKLLAVWIARHDPGRPTALRIDVVAVHLPRAGRPEITHLRAVG